MDLLIALALLAAAVVAAAVIVGALVWALRALGLIRPRRAAHAMWLDDPEATQELPRVQDWPGVDADGQWMAGEREADAEIAAGRLRSFDDADGMFTALDEGGDR